MSMRSKWVVLVCLVAVLLAGGALAAQTPVWAQKKPDVVVAQVGDKRLYLEDLNRATAPFKHKYEKQGYDLSSESGQSLYQRLQSSVLNNMIVQYLLELGAAEKRVSVTAAEVTEAYKKELASRGQTEASLVKELKSYGWTKPLFVAELRRRLIEDKFVDRFIAKGKTGDSRVAAVNQWLTDRAGKTSIEVYFQVSAGGGDVLEEAEKAALDLYRKNGGKDGATARATNYGCHIQVDVLVNGKVVKSYGYGGGEVYEL